MAVVPTMLAGLVLLLVCSGAQAQFFPCRSHTQIGGKGVGNTRVSHIQCLKVRQNQTGIRWRIHAPHQNPKVSLDRLNYGVTGDMGSRNDNLYAQCVLSIPSNCTVSIAPIGYSTIQKNCSFQPPNDDRVSVLNELHRFDDGKVALSWIASGSRFDTSVSILNMSDCSLSHSDPHRFSLDSNETSVMPILHDNGFDVFIKNETVCAGVAGKCRVSYDSDGRRVGNPVPLDTDLVTGKAWTVAANSSVKGYFTAGNVSSKELNVTLQIKSIGRSGRMSDLTKDGVAQFFWTDTGKPETASNAQKNFVVCWSKSYSPTLRCAQFNETNEVKSNVSSLTLPERFLLKVENLAGDGLLLIKKTRPYENNGLLIRKVHVTEKIPGRSRECSLPVRFPKMDIVETEDELVLYFPCLSFREIVGRQLVDANALL